MSSTEWLAPTLLLALGAVALASLIARFSAAGPAIAAALGFVAILVALQAFEAEP